MPNKDGTGPDGKGPKNVKQGTPTPKKDGSGACWPNGGGNKCGNRPCGGRQ